MLKKKHYLALGAVTLAALLIFSLPQRATSRLKLATGSLFLPLFGLLNTAQQLPVDAANAVMPRRALLREIGELQGENQQLRIQSAQTAAMARENDQLRALIGWQRQTPWKLKLANVIVRDPANWWRSVQIDLGSRDGLRENLPDCRVSARVENPAHDIGVIGASGPLDTSLVELTYLSGNADLKSGEGVVTSGEGEIFPPGIPIGQVVDSRAVEFGLYTEARVKLSTNLGALEQVWVLFP